MAESSPPTLLSQATHGTTHLESKVETPFDHPQTNLVLGKANYIFDFRGERGSRFTYLADEPKLINSYGFDIEVKQSRFFNIGFASRFNITRLRLENDVFTQHSPTFVNCLFGGYIRGLIVQSFYKGSLGALALYSRLDVSTGPFLVDTLGGFSGQAGLKVGFDYYFNKWLGLGLGLGYNLFCAYRIPQNEYSESMWILGKGFESSLSLKTTLY